MAWQMWNRVKICMKQERCSTRTEQDVCHYESADWIGREVWQERDEKQNFPQRFDAQLVREEKRLEVEEEIRVQVRGEERRGEERREMERTKWRERKHEHDGVGGRRCRSQVER